MKTDRSLYSQAQVSLPPFLQRSYPWVESVFASLSSRERIAQLIHVASWSNRGEGHLNDVLELIGKFGIGGVIFFQGDPLSQAEFTNRYQAVSRVPLMISIDAEWGLAMRLDHSVQFPYQMALGAVQDDHLIYQMGRELARQCKRLGIHTNFAPCVDINTQAENPVIGFRSFGETPGHVIPRAFAYMKGMQDQGVLAVGKHFPGHGDTSQDSHFTLPSLPHREDRLFEIELAPYQQLIPLGLGGVMTGHLRVPVWDERVDRGATLSKAITTGILRDKLAFDGLIFTDALDMKGVTNHFPPGVIEVEALLAGNDILLFSVEVEKAISGIETAILQGKITQEEIDLRCKKLLAAKAWAGLDNYRPIETKGIFEDLNNAFSHTLNQQLAKASIHIPEGFDPEVMVNYRCAVLSVKLGKARYSSELKHHELNKKAESRERTLSQVTFQRSLSDSARVASFSLNFPLEAVEFSSLLAKLNQYERLIISLHGLEVKARDRFGLTEEQLEVIQQICQHPFAVLVIFGSKYVVNHLRGSENLKAVIHAWQESDYAQQAAADLFISRDDQAGL